MGLSNAMTPMIITPTNVAIIANCRAVVMALLTTVKAVMMAMTIMVMTVLQAVSRLCVAMVTYKTGLRVATTAMPIITTVASIPVSL